jgi:hypothetical protein
LKKAKIFQKAISQAYDLLCHYHAKQKAFCKFHPPNTLSFTDGKAALFLWIIEKVLFANGLGS